MRQPRTVPDTPDTPDTELGVDVRVANLVKRFPTGERVITAVDDTSFTVSAGEVVALAGASGSGKSTLLHLIGGLEQADAGEIHVGGIELCGLGNRDRTAYRRSVGLVFQRFHLLPALSALDNVIVPVLPYRRGARNLRERARHLLAEVGLEGREGSIPSQLSGGQQQRVAIARALINTPRLLLADEPTGNLDSRTGAEIIELMFALRREHHTTIMIATHDAGLADRCDRVLRIIDGRLAEDI